MCINALVGRCYCFQSDWRRHSTRQLGISVNLFLPLNGIHVWHYNKSTSAASISVAWLSHSYCSEERVLCIITQSQSLKSPHLIPISTAGLLNSHLSSAFLARCIGEEEFTLPSGMKSDSSLYSHQTLARSKSKCDNFSTALYATHLWQDSLYVLSWT